MVVVYLSKRTKATDISNKVRQAVRERDSYDGMPCCIFCGKPRANDTMHYIPRSSGGLGIEENLAIGCRECHRKLDQSTQRETMMKFFKAYLDNHYPNFTDEERKFKK